jgi:hypothetical protein
MKMGGAQIAVVLSHHAPSFRGTSHPKYGIGESPISSAFASDLHHLMRKYSKVLKVWAHGHTHYNSDRMLENVRVVSNQRGYPRPYVEATDYKNDLAIALDLPRCLPGIPAMAGGFSPVIAQNWGQCGSPSFAELELPGETLSAEESLCSPQFRDVIWHMQFIY